MNGIAAAITSTITATAVSTLLTRMCVRSVSSPRPEGLLPTECEHLLQRDEHHEEERDPDDRGPPDEQREEQGDRKRQAGQVAAHPTSAHRSGEAHAR
jgi:hypothetical protein